MADIIPTITKDVDGNPGAILVKWEALSDASKNGSPIKFTGYTIRSVQVTGTFGASGSVSIRGSNDDGANYHTLSADNSTGAVTFTAAGVKRVSEVTQLTKPVVTVSDGTTDLDVSLLLVRE